MMNKETNYDRHERLMQPIRDAQAKTKSKTIPIKELLNDFSKIDDECSIDEEKNEIHIGNFTLILKEQDWWI